MKARSLPAFFLCAALLVCAGCASFRSEWRKSVNTIPAPSGLAGPWEGTWNSQVTGHHEMLRCIVTREADGSYQARFHAKYHTSLHWVVHFGYTARLAVREAGGVYKFQGSANLGRLAGGVYHYDGSVSGGTFTSTYTSKYDHGVFEMKRPRPGSRLSE